ncbi:BREX-1 system adenine-specific DNA-methyltransferase PglX [Cyanobium sp. FGCU-6]|nr:BREX-1 system adenine-specific DNA-methyltransferase PglX [Cyanobium sp. FGCU6]
MLAWQPGDLRKPEEMAAPIAVPLDDYDEVLRPDWIVGEPSPGDGPLKAQLLVQELPVGTPFDALPRGADGRRCWEATPQQRLERLLKESEHPIGLIWNGVALRLVYAPRGESSGHLTFPLEPMTTVDGRPMLAALQMLLGPDRLFEGGASNTRLRPLMEQSRKEQNEVSTRLAEQVLEALWILLRGFDAAGLKVEDPSHIYGGLITVLLRLVFLLYAEDEELMPTDSLYGQHYSVGGLAQRLRQDRTDHQNAMEGRRGAWATLLSLFRLVYDGGGPSEAYLPARHGDLFDPDAYPFLEGRPADTSYTDGPLTSVPAISDDVVELVLTKLLLLDGQILSYRALDVEQIGSVYEGIMGFMVEKASGPSVGITHRPPRQKITITVVVNAEQLLAQPASKREKWLDDQAGVALKLPAKTKQGLKEAASLDELCLALGNRLSPHTPRGLAPGSLILQPTAERRRSGSHYTPRALTEPIVAEAFRPWLERCHGQPTAEQILALKVCDPAMGSGAFLVAVCRFLADWLVQAWEREGYPEGFKAEWDKDNVARRLIAQRCLYGVDKNPFAVNLAKLSLWLVTLSQDLPFTFVDHALKCGDSLVGYSMQEIRAAMREVQLGFLDDQNRIYEQLGINRRESFAFDSLTDADYDTKKLRLEQQIKATEGLRKAGDLMVAAFFAKTKTKERADKQQVYLAMLSGTFHDDALMDSVQEIRERLAAGDQGIRPFHWDLEFPEVFDCDDRGFNAIVGNPPYIGGSLVKGAAGERYLQYLLESYLGSHGKADLCSYFVQRVSKIASRIHGSYSMVVTSSITEGRTRETGLTSIVAWGDTIYFARRKFKWPGLASVYASRFAAMRGKTDKAFKKILDNKSVNEITSYFLSFGPSASPLPLSQNKGYAYSGVNPNGKGFILDETELLSLSLDEQERSFVLPFLGSDEMNSTPHAGPIRFAIRVKHDDEKVLISECPRLHKHLKDTVWEARQKSSEQRLRRLWWQFSRPANDLYLELEKGLPVLASGRHSEYTTFAFQNCNTIFSDAVTAFIPASNSFFALLQSRIHELWALLQGSSLGSTPRYIPEDCFDTFPFPTALLDSSANDLVQEGTRKSLEAIGEGYHKFRGELMVRNNEGLTSTYNRFHDPAETSSGLLELRRLHGEMDQAVLAAYGWSDVLQLGPSNSPCGFGLDYLDTEEDAQLPDELQERIDSGDLFFWDAKDALDFQGQLQATGAITGRRKLPWRYRWPDAVRDDVLARLLALNAERYQEEVNLGLHSKAGKQAAKAAKAAGAAAGTKRPGRPAKSSQSGETEQDHSEQMGLGL